MPDADTRPIPVNDELQTFNCEAAAIIREFADRLKLPNEHSQIYHYTNVDGLKGILNMGTLWFTDIFNLNDPSELQHGIDAAVAILKQRTATGHAIGQDVADSIYRQVCEEQKIRDVINLFTCSFSFHRDDLCQWRAYADNGCGYALVFDAEELVDGFTKAFPGSGSERWYRATFPLTYDDELLSVQQEKIIKHTLPLIYPQSNREVYRHQIPTYYCRVSAWIVQNAVISRLCFKHKAYSNEQEFRLVLGDLQNPSLPLERWVKRRSRRNTEVRYVEFNWGQDLLICCCESLVVIQGGRRCRLE